MYELHWSTVGELVRFARLVDSTYWLPPHFLNTTFSSLGGRVVILTKASQEVALGLLFPRSWRADKQGYTLRCYPLVSLDLVEQQQFSQLLRQELAAEVSYYNPQDPQLYPGDEVYHSGEVVIGRPYEAEAAAVPFLQQEIWGHTSESLYPADLHSYGFELGTSLVARYQGRVVAFLLGFYKFGVAKLPEPYYAKLNTQFSLESQVLGVHKDYRQQQLGYQLKRVQAQKAIDRGINLINWTVDPLLVANAQLNFNRLKAVAFEFYPDLYKSFHNTLNKVSASRFKITWLIESGRVKARLADTGVDSPNPDFMAVNESIESTNLSATASVIGIEIPANWLAIQQFDVILAQQWRATTDLLFSHYLGTTVGKYVITRLATRNQKSYLLGEQITPSLLERLIT